MVFLNCLSNHSEVTFPKLTLAQIINNYKYRIFLSTVNHQIRLSFLYDHDYYNVKRFFVRIRFFQQFLYLDFYRGTTVELLSSYNDMIAEQKLLFIVCPADYWGSLSELRTTQNIRRISETKHLESISRFEFLFMTRTQDNNKILSSLKVMKYVILLCIDISYLQKYNHEE